MVWEVMSFEEFQDRHHGGRLGYQNGTILAILNLCLTVMHPIKFQLNRTYGLGGDVVWRISRWRPSWISEPNDFSNSESLCLCDASHQVLTQSNLRFGRRCCLKNFKMAIMAAVLDIRTEEFQWPSLILERNNFSNSESLCHLDASHQVLTQSDLPSWISKWNDFSNSESLCHCDASRQVSAQSD